MWKIMKKVHLLLGQHKNNGRTIRIFVLLDFLFAGVVNSHSLCPFLGCSPFSHRIFVQHYLIYRLDCVFSEIVGQFELTMGAQCGMANTSVCTTTTKMEYKLVVGRFYQIYSLNIIENIRTFRWISSMRREKRKKELFGS